MRGTACCPALLGRRGPPGKGKFPRGLQKRAPSVPPPLPVLLPAPACGGAPPQPALRSTAGGLTAPRARDAPPRATSGRAARPARPARP